MKPVPIARPLHRMLVASIAMLVIVPSVAAQGGEPAEPRIHFLLRPLVESPSDEIPEPLRGELGGFQGRRQIDGRPALSLILRGNPDRAALEELGVRVRTQIEGIATLDVLPERLADLLQVERVVAISLPKVFEPILETSVPTTGVDDLRSQTAGVFSGNTGDGVIVGVVDSGIDLDHPNFRHPNGSTRLLYVLDQTTGATCTAVDIDANSCTQVDIASALGHGTHVTGIAAGNGAAPGPGGMPYAQVGMAPEADIIFVKTSWVGDDIIDAMQFIFDKANALAQPVVINLSLGTHAGAHDGTDEMEEYIDTMVTAQNGRAVVIAAGNEREDEIHAERPTKHMVSVVGPDFEVQPYQQLAGIGNDSFLIAGYYRATDDLLVHLWSPTGDYLNMPLNTSPWGSPCVAQNTASGFVALCNNFESQLGQSTGDRE
ncbi:MAG: S8 family serine peptidase, partial [Holophagales bacterium]|nr:S8 family serine peptidase [Holophagales bacterium]